MSQVAQLRRRQVIDEEVLVAVEEIIAQARAGEIVDLVVVANDAGGKAFVRIADYQDCWRTLGALEYAKSAVIGGLGVPE